MWKDGGRMVETNIDRIVNNHKHKLCYGYKQPKIISANQSVQTVVGQSRYTVRCGTLCSEEKLTSSARHSESERDLRGRRRRQSDDGPLASVTVGDFSNVHSPWAVSC